jgi:predicted AAA+ superfamily ATPase
MIPRTAAPVLRTLAARNPVVTLTGPRQSGKTTLCRATFPGKPYATLERPDVREFARSDPRGFLRDYPDGAILDEVQHLPELPSHLQVLVDERPEAGQWILTGSEQFEVLNRVSQSLAGRTALLKLLPFSIEEMARHFEIGRAELLIHSGFYPRIHDRRLEPTQALGDYFETYVQRDLRALVAIGDLATFTRFVRLAAARCGQVLNLAGLASDTGISHTTARKWLSLLEASYIAFELTPFFRNVGKRLVKSPKLYFYDVGLAAYLLDVRSAAHVRAHPLRGALFENLVVVEALKWFLHRGRRGALCFYRDNHGNEVDVLLELGAGVYPIEVKAGETVNPDFFRGLRAFARLYDVPPPNGGAVVYGGDERRARREAWVVPYHRVHELVAAVAR